MVKDKSEFANQFYDKAIDAIKEYEHYQSYKSDVTPCTVHNAVRDSSTDSFASTSAFEYSSVDSDLECFLGNVWKELLDYQDSSCIRQLAVNAGVALPRMIDKSELEQLPPVDIKKSIRESIKAAEQIREHYYNLERDDPQSYALESLETIFRGISNAREFSSVEFIWKITDKFNAENAHKELERAYNVVLRLCHKLAYKPSIQLELNQVPNYVAWHNHWENLTKYVQDALDRNCPERISEQSSTIEANSPIPPLSPAEPAPFLFARDEKDNTPDGISEVRLTDRQETILREMYSAEVFTHSAKLKQHEIVAKCQRGAEAGTWKRAFSELVKAQYLSSCTGPAGGCWLTSKGKQHASTLLN